MSDIGGNPEIVVRDAVDIVSQADGELAATADQLGVPVLVTFSLHVTPDATANTCCFYTSEGVLIQDPESFFGACEKLIHFINFRSSVPAEVLNAISKARLVWHGVLPTNARGTTSFSSLVVFYTSGRSYVFKTRNSLTNWKAGLYERWFSHSTALIQ
jgi:hypothetical protein